MLLFNWWLSRPLKKGRSIVTRYLGATTAKLLLSLVVLAVYVFARKEEVIPFTVHFLSLYLLYTVFEVAVLYRQFSSAKSS